jgi:hypothetical protein
LNYQLAYDICKIYTTNPDNVDYMKLMTQLLRDIKKAIGSSQFNDNFDPATRTFYGGMKKMAKKLRPMSARSTSTEYIEKKKGM